MRCEVIQDLLPLYQDGLCSPVTAELVRQHLSACPDCARAAERMYVTPSALSQQLKNLEIDENQFTVVESIIHSMTPAERNNPHRSVSK